MQTDETRKAYLRRMLNRIVEELDRLEKLVAAGELSKTGLDMCAELLKKEESEFRSELDKLESPEQSR